MNPQRVRALAGFAETWATEDLIVLWKAATGPVGVPAVAFFGGTTVAILRPAAGVPGGVSGLAKAFRTGAGARMMRWIASSSATKSPPALALPDGKYP